MSSITSLNDLLSLNRVIETYYLKVAPDTLVNDAITLMLNISYGDEEKPSCILVIDECRLVGIFTQEVALRIAVSGKDLSTMPVSQVMIRQVISLKKTANQNILTALKIIREHEISHLPIVDEEDNLLGIIEEKNLLQFFVDEHERIIHTIKHADANGKPDINHIRAAEAQIKFDANILAHVSDAVIAVDKEHKIIYLNQRAEQQYNIKAADFIGRSLKDVYQYRWLKEEDRQFAKESLSRSAWWQGENIHVKKNGEEIYVELSVSLLKNHRGEQIGLLAVIRDITKRKQAEEKLRQTEDLLQEAERIAKIGSWSWDLAKNESWWSRELYRFTNRNKGNSKPNVATISQFIHPADRERINKLTLNAIEKGIPYETEFRFICSDGSIGYAFSCGKVEKDEKGNIVRFYGISKDVTEYKQAEAALRESEERFRIMADTAPVMIWMSGCDKLYHYFNAKWLEFTGKTLEHELGNGWTQGVHPDDRQRCIEIYVNSFDARQAFSMEYRLQNKHGEYRWVLDKGTPRFDADENFVGYIGSCIDITERKQAEEKIAQQAVLLDVATDAILLRSVAGEILYCNQSAERMYGWTADEAVGKKADELLYKEVTQELTEALQEVGRSGSWQGELHKITKQGREITVASRWTLVSDEAGNPKSILTVDTDITEKKLLESQFLRAQRLESLGTLASGIAHDLNNMLTPILAIAQLLPLKLGHVDDTSKEMLQMLEANTKRGANLVKQVLSFARGNEGKRTVLQVKHLLKDIEQFAKGTFPKSITIERNLPRDLWTVSADATQLHQVFMNLVVNARDSMPEGGTLSIEAENKFIDESYAKMNIEAQVGSYVLVTIADTGIGISPQIIDRIFDPFFTTKQVGEGTGLGLSTVLGIVKNHGGFIEVSSKIDSYTQFKVYLPSIEDKASVIPENKQFPSGNNELILVVDDEAGICEIIKTTLETYNFRVITAKDGIEALAIYVQRKKEINIVLIDIMMPLMDGETAIRTLQQINPQVKIIAMSGLLSNETLAEANGNIFQAFLSKPFSASELLNALARVKNKS
ncbi:PAS domain S-box [Rivularia sp. PCC 7116]|uniref:PAS domain S-box protein n=1 Tax=Rivularia sp. PCC 7116 TaxID=373994 RepID=UPI00029EFB3F|nr:PAS domain S-box protein [Rivularia sp. PCC 7116]AFY56369.1 PAS domain S-box [Rivularia sp. PCC 7116]